MKNPINPLTGETAVECSQRLMRQASTHYNNDGDAREYCKVRVECFINSKMAENDSRLAEFYKAVLTHLTTPERTT